MQHPKRAAVANRLLAVLPNKYLERLLANCETVELKFADILCLPGDRIRHVYFPTDSFISLVAPIDDYPGLGVGMIGSEGMFGIARVLGVNFAPMHALVQGSGSALRMNAKQFCRELEDSPALRARLNRYLYVMTQQFARMAACTHYHVVEARLARWLLMSRDRARSDKFYVTQEFLSHILGVRRVGVSAAAAALQKRKLIHYSRGFITILNSRALQAAACECYIADKRTYDLMLG